MEVIATREIALALSREQCVLIVEGLAERPFREVFGLIGLLCASAEAGVRLSLQPDQLRLILDTLGGMPFTRVCTLLQSMQQQLRAQQD